MTGKHLIVCWKSCFVLLLLLLLQNCSTFSVTGSKVEYLPGFHGPLPFDLQTGYIGVGESEEVQFFYFFIKSESNPAEDPLVLWLSGGPGCSSLSGLAFEIGPIVFEAAKYLLESEYKNDVPKLILNPYSWTKMASIIFLDMPVGTGFSYSNNPKALESTDLQTYVQVNEFLRKFLVHHAEFKQNHFYVGGDSFAGQYIPVITQLVLDGNKNGMEPFINLKGYLIGNGLTTPEDSNYMMPFARGMGLIPDELYQSWKRNCNGGSENPSNLQCSNDVATFQWLIKDIELYNILENSCGVISPRPADKFSQKRLLEDEYHQHGFGSSKCRTDEYTYLENWARSASVQEALQVRKGTIKKWIRCSKYWPYRLNVKDTVPYHANLSRNGLRSLIYSGDHDMVVPFISTEAWIKSLKYPIIIDWHPWMVDGQVAGYTRTYANQMTFATVKGAGHTAPEYKQLECQSMFQRWISFQSL